MSLPKKFFIRFTTALSDFEKSSLVSIVPVYTLHLIVTPLESTNLKIFIPSLDLLLLIYFIA